MLRLATSSQDKTIRIWDLENPGSSIRTFTGHSASVMSLDFHPKEEDCICSCDENEIRFWTIMSAGCTKVSKLDTAYLTFSGQWCMTRSSIKELLTPFENWKQVLRSRRKLFETPSLVESNSPEFDQPSKIEEHIEEE
nr:transcriptional corepressor LEUNIG-like [Tanacetum cinerariifolium]